MVSMSSSSVAPLSFANCRWKVSCSVLPLVVRAATVTRLRSFGESCGRVHTCPKSTSSVKPTSAGAKSPNIFSAPDGSLSSAIVSILSWEVSARGAQQQCRARGEGGDRGGGQEAGPDPGLEGVGVGEQRAEHSDGQGAA